MQLGIYVDNAPSGVMQLAELQKVREFNADILRAMETYRKASVRANDIEKETSADQIAPEHKVSIDGYEDRLGSLVERVHRLRYDQVVELYRYLAAELRQQAEGEAERGRSKLAALLSEAAVAAEEQQERFARIWTLCKPHMKV